MYLDVPLINATINEYICSILEEVSFKLIWMISYYFTTTQAVDSDRPAIRFPHSVPPAFHQEKNNAQVWKICV